MRIYLIFLSNESIIKNMTQEPRNILSQHKVSITNPRIIVLDTLLDFGNPITIEELQSKLKGKVAKSTLYRVLNDLKKINILNEFTSCLLYTSPSPRDKRQSRMPSSA